jgi:hypothetical protein
MLQTENCETREIQTWSDFEGAIRDINCDREEQAKDRGLRLPDLLFRGLGSSVWGLETTLERSYPLERCDESLSFRKYYRKTSTAKPAIDQPRPVYISDRFSGWPLVPLLECGRPEIRDHAGGEFPVTFPTFEKLRRYPVIAGCHDVARSGGPASDFYPVIAQE